MELCFSNFNCFVRIDGIRRYQPRILESVNDVCIDCWVNDLDDVMGGTYENICC